MKFCVDCNKPNQKVLWHDSRCLGVKKCQFKNKKFLLSKMSLLSSNSSRALSKRGRCKIECDNLKLHNNFINFR